MAWTTPFSWTVGDIATAARINTYRDCLNAIGGAWTAYTPTLTAATTNPTMGASSITGRHRILGKTADVHISFTVGAGYSAGSGVYRFSWPAGVSPLNTSVNEAVGFATAVDASAGATYKSIAYNVSSTVFSLLGDAGVLGHASPFAWATGDRVSIHIPALEIT